MDTPTVIELDAAVAALAAWQYEGAPIQLHPGDLGWLWRFGAESTAAAVRTWTRGGRIVSVGFLDGADVFRLTLAPDVQRDEQLARQLAADLASPERGILGEGRVAVEAPPGAAVLEHLAGIGWKSDEPWTPLRRDLSGEVEHCGLRVEIVGPDLVDERVRIQRASFSQSIFTSDSWRAMAAGPAYRDARCLLGFDQNDVAVAAVTVWSAGAGKPGLLEPMGVHSDHRGHGYGKAITIAAAAALRDLGSSSAIVCTESSNFAGVATYRSAGFEPGQERRDRFRDA